MNHNIDRAPIDYFKSLSPKEKIRILELSIDLMSRKTGTIAANDTKFTVNYEVIK